MCTIGTLRLGRHEYLLFKNKDFGRDSFADQIFLSEDVVGIQGVSTWANSDSSQDQFSGFSIGANRYGLFCCDANVREEPATGWNYDLLTEIALREGTDVESAIKAVDRAVGRHPYWCSNLMLVDGVTSAAIEVHGSEIAIERHTERLTRTNHHLLFGDRPMDEDTITTESRLSFSRERLTNANSIEDIQGLQASHDSNDETTGICNHSAHQTVYSYILYCKDGEMSLLVRQGRPCSGSVYHCLTPPIGNQWSQEGEALFRSSYPSDSLV